MPCHVTDMCLSRDSLQAFLEEMRELSNGPLSYLPLDGVRHGEGLTTVACKAALAAAIVEGVSELLQMR